MNMIDHVASAEKNQLGIRFSQTYSYTFSFRHYLQSQIMRHGNYCVNDGFIIRDYSHIADNRFINLYLLNGQLLEPAY
jgi:hypothetical protein